MRSLRPSALLFTLSAMIVASPPAALAEEPTKADAPAAAAEPAPSPFVGDFLKEIDRVRGQIESLAAATPQETYGWRPADGVRSVAEVYLHIAFGNYLLPKVTGYPVPADLADQLSVAKLQAWDTSTTDKGAIAERVGRSFDHLRSTVAAIPEADLDATVEFFGQTPTKRQMLLLVLGHLHEHLGQSIAYARSNGIAPPWSAAQQAAQRQAAEAGEGP